MALSIELIFAMLVPLFVEENARRYLSSKTMASSKKRKSDHEQAAATLEEPALGGRDILSLVQRNQKRPRRQRTSPTSPSKIHITSPKTQPPLPLTNAGDLLRPCHICYRRPMTKTDLTCYADCDNCSKRSCYICMRECEEADCKLATHNNEEEWFRTDTESTKQASEKGRRKPRLCRHCTVESILADGTDMTRCWHCAEGQSSWDLPRDTSELDTPC